ncbi:MAG: hypothetical protein HKP44_06280 [Desulfofustis sp.]|nr:hypothetical protein [Desulfofustis sp.]
MSVAIRRFSLLVLVASFGAVLLNTSAAWACTICVPYPERTLADRLLENGEIIFAREMENSPYVFAPIEPLRGAEASGPIKLFCDSATRRKLLYIPDSAVVLARKSSEDEWRMITFADRSYQPFIRAIVDNGNKWLESPGNDDRVRYFSGLLTSEHSQILEQAYLEVGRAPYSMIKPLAREIPREQIYQFLANFRFIEWHSLYILFLGQSDNPDDRAYIRKQAESAARLGMTINLAAWLTAFIETHPESGLEEVKTWYFSNPDRSKDELEQVITSLSVLGSQESGGELPLFLLRDNIVNSYALLLDNYPEMAGRVARDLAMWQVRAHVERLTEIRRRMPQADPSEIYQLDHYLSMAPSYPQVGPHGLN